MELDGSSLGLEIQLKRVDYGNSDDLLVQSLRRFIEHTVSTAFAVQTADLQRPTRGQAKVAFARQVAMYLAHVSCGLTLTQVGILFDRDRTTVAHACGVVEDRRDNADLDLALDLLDAVLRSREAFFSRADPTFF